MVLAGLAFIGLTPVNAQEFDVTTNMSCTAAIGDPNRAPAFSSPISFKVVGDRISGIRPAGKRPGREVYAGTIDANGTIKIFGRGGYYDSNYTWTSNYSGTVKYGERLHLHGTMQSSRGWRRNCTITVLEAPEALTARFGPKEASKLEVSKNEQRLIPVLTESASSQQPSQQQSGQKQPTNTEKKGEVSRQDPAIPSLQQQQELQRKQLKQQEMLQKQLADAQRELKQTQETLAKQQATAKEQASWVQNVLGGIILPPSEDPNSWMLRVAAVPVQQQQFCRIVDQFYDRLSDIYKARNDIKRNALYRDRKISLATLLPRGEFQNWVVQIKEVTQAADGSAAVMLQPPCRAMLGSDACQKDGSKIRATIQPSSVLFRELERVSSGDFVIVSGKILYAESTNTDQPLPTYAVYQAGSHCSASAEGKQSDVFVTEINYLVQLR